MLIKDLFNISVIVNATWQKQCGFNSLLGIFSITWVEKITIAQQ